MPAPVVDRTLPRSGATVALPASPASPVRRVVWLVGLSHFANHFVMLIFPAVLLLLHEEFHLGYFGLGLFANLALLFYGVGALPAGVLADRLGGERILVVWLLGGSLACLTIGLSSGPVALALGLAALGLFASLHHPAGAGVLVALRNAAGLDVGRAFGLNGGLGNLGLAASPLLSSAVAVRWGWRAAFLVGAIPGLVLALPLWRSRRLPAGHPPNLHSPVAHRRVAAWRELTLPLLILFALETLMGFVFQGFSTFLPAYLSEHGQMSALTATQVARGGSFASLALLFGGLGHLAAGRLMASRHREAIFLAITGATALSLFGMGTTTGLPLVLLSIALSVTYFSLGTISNTFIAFHTPPHLGGTAFGITFTLSLGVGSLASSVMGFLGQRFGLAAAFTTLGTVAVAATALVLWFGHTTGALAPGNFKRKTDPPAAEQPIN